MKLAFVTPRYGADLTTGPEHACRLLAEHIGHRHDIDVLTTCARDARTWKNDYAEGPDRMRGVRVRRFPVTEREPDPSALDRLATRLLAEPHSRDEELEWVRRKGPWAPGLLDHLKRQHRNYDALVFFGLMTATTVFGLPMAPEHSVLFPHVDLKPTLRLGLWPELLLMPRALGLLSTSERRILHDFVRVQPQYEELVGIGIEPSPQHTYPRHQQDPSDAIPVEDDLPGDTEPAAEESYLAGRGMPFRRRHRLYGRIALYGGRVEPDNGCQEMLEYFDGYASTNGDVSLVLMGVKMMRVPDEPYLRQAGMLPERERMIAFEAADVTIAPAPDDLLAQSVLESMAVGTPVLASARNASAVAHCRRSNAGLFYENREEFVEAMRLMARNPELRERLGEAGRHYVEQHYRWDAVIGRFERLMTRVKPR
ncbi:MAG TPA: glycosyltransferase [Vicinamibacterales bacterium]|nr:glycosyltransferase [Vicinamibacterales bacterium]